MEEARYVAPPAYTPLDLLLCCTLAYRFHGTPQAIKGAAFRVGLHRAAEWRHLPAMFINCNDPVDVLTRGLDYWDDE